MFEDTRSEKKLEPRSQADAADYSSTPTPSSPAMLSMMAAGYALQRALKTRLPLAAKVSAKERHDGEPTQQPRPVSVRACRNFSKKACPLLSHSERSRLEAGQGDTAPKKT